MSNWVYINGVINLDMIGRTQHEKTYILNTVLDHLPRVTGSEGDMEVYVNQERGHNSSCSHDEFGFRTDNLVDRYGCKNRDCGWLECNDGYMLTLSAYLRDREAKETFREFMKWICRLAKRVHVTSALVNIHDLDNSFVINETSWDNPYSEMFEYPSWYRLDEEPAWYEYLMWDREKESGMPLKLAYKYYADDDIDAEMAHRHDYYYKDENGT